MNNPAHPGAVLREWLPKGLAMTQAAYQLGISRHKLGRILKGSASISPDIALRLSAWLDTSPDVWIDMQSSWDLWQAKQHGTPAIKPLRTLVTLEK